MFVIFPDKCAPGDVQNIDMTMLSLSIVHKCRVFTLCYHNTWLPFVTSMLPWDVHMHTCICAEKCDIDILNLSIHYSVEYLHFVTNTLGNTLLPPCYHAMSIY